ncbi:MAG: dihydroorotase [Deltaproteobacteria bacterium]|nr:dihydroorotase [Deltaproteobacteria bacterium]
MARLWIRGGRVLDPAGERDEQADVFVEDGRIAALGAPGALGVETAGAEVIDAAGCWVAPGFVDLHVHLREPGQEYKEDIASGGRCGVAGGFTAVVCMANTQPPNDDPAVTEYILDRARQESPARVYPVAAATRGLAGEVMTEMTALVEAGVVAFSDDGRTIMDSGVMRRVLEYSGLVRVPIITHAEDRTLVREGVVNEGPVSTRLGLPGNSAVAEVVHVARDLMLAELTGAHLHVAHVSTAGAVDLIRTARERGVHVTAEVTPHHLTLTDEATLGYDTNTKMAPPLRGARDVEACRAALADGTIDAIATDHAPHAVHEKDVEFTAAPPGVIGLETAVPVTLELVRAGELTPLAWVRRLSTGPARIIGRPGGSLAVGAAADLVVIDPERRWTYDPAKGFSKSRNSPWVGRELIGRAMVTVVGGTLVYDAHRGVLVP